MSEPTKDNKSKERIAKRMARAGVASRREAERMIEAGRVSVNGKLLKTPAFTVTDQDSVVVDGVELAEKEPPRLWRYHKPDGLLTTHNDPKGRETVFSKLPKELPRVISIGRLDLTSEGLLLLTNDGELARKLELPKTGWTRKYRARAYGKVDQKALDTLKKGIKIDGVPTGPIIAELESQKGDNYWIGVTIREGKNREVRRAMETLGLRVNRLIRISYGPFQLGDLAKGGIEEVKRSVLRDQVGHLIDIPKGTPTRSKRAASNRAGKPSPKGRVPRADHSGKREADRQNRQEKAKRSDSRRPRQDERRKGGHKPRSPQKRG